MKRWLFALLLVAGCTPYRDVCGDLRSGLEKCGFELSRIDCSKLTYSDLEQLTEKLDDRGCAAMSPDGNAVDPRICTLANWSCPGPSVPVVEQAATVHPVVFIGGIDGNAVLDWNPKILEGFASEPVVRVSHLKVLSWATTPERANDLWESLQSLQPHLGGGKLNLVCYAVGGIDCRYLVSPNGLFANDPVRHAQVLDTVASITTIATPHRGTRVAEAALDAIQSGTASDVLQTWLGPSLATNIPDDSTLIRTLNGLTLDAISQLNTTLIDAPEIVYQSWAGVSQVLGRASDATEAAIQKHCVRADGTVVVIRAEGTHDALNPVLWVTAPFAATIHRDGVSISGPSDGMIAVESAKWGEFQGCVAADHYDVIGQIGHTTRDPLTGFDAPGFYRYLVTGLAARGL